MSEQRAKQLAATFIADHEGMRTEAYPDPLHGWRVPTIGYGTTTYPDGTPVKRGDKKTPEYLRLCLVDFIDRQCLPHLRSMPTWPLMNEYQQAALISFGYNTGPRFFRAKNRESITKLCIMADYWRDVEFVVTTFVKYRNPGSSVENGLRKRRLLEADLFLHIGD